MKSVRCVIAVCDRGVQVVFYVFASTHFHLLLIVSDTEQMADFMEYVGSNIARELGHLFEWPQKFWGQSRSWSFWFFRVSRPNLDPVPLVPRAVAG